MLPPPDMTREEQTKYLNTHNPYDFITPLGKEIVQVIDTVTDAIPLIGHIKAAVFFALGNYERGVNAFLAATKTALELITTAVCGACTIMFSFLWDMSETVIRYLFRSNMDPKGTQIDKNGFYFARLVCYLG